MTLHHLSVENERLRAEITELKARKLHTVIYCEEPVTWSTFNEAKAFMRTVLMMRSDYRTRRRPNGGLADLERLDALTEEYAAANGYDSNDGNYDESSTVVYTCHTWGQTPEWFSFSYD